MKKKTIIIISIAFLLLIAGGIGAIYYYKNANNLTISEKKYIDDAKATNKVISINVLNNAYLFGYNGEGVFYDFIDDFNKKYELNINPVTYNYGTKVSGVTLGAKTKLSDDDIVLYTDHYVLISKNRDVITSNANLNGKTINILSSDVSYVSAYIGGANVNYASHEKADDLFNAIADDGYAILPLHLYLGSILAKDFNIIYHFSDINIYFTLTSDDTDFSNILVKYYNDWKEDLITYYNKHLFVSLCTILNLSETEIAQMQSKNYEYGFINNSPYEVISSGNYGGIAAVYLKKFMDFADLDFKFSKYRDYKRFNKALNNNDVDIYFGYYELDNKFNSTSGGIIMSYSIIANKKNPIVINSIYALNGKEVYVEKYSKLETYLKSIGNIDVKTYSSVKELKKLNKKDVIIFIDSNTFDYYRDNGLDNYSVRYSNYINDIYSFKLKDDSVLYKLFNKFIDIQDSKSILNEGIYNHANTIKYGVLLSLIARYFIYILVIGIIVAYIVIRKTKKITIAKKVSKNDTLRFIDQLTLLKNRNYLKENIEKWNNNTIYPQTILVVDLNRVQQINDIEGYEEGDKQIKAASNILIKTQLDNSDIVRTDGNEFLIYLVGYSQKQITNYIHKLNKEFKKLPYNYGAEFGYSMIIDDIKTIEDALNEATKTLKEQKGNNEKKD